MPLLRLKTSNDIPLNRQQEIMAAMSGLVADATGKPETYVMVVLEHDPIMMSGRLDAPAALVELFSIGGLNPDVNRELSARICNLLNERLDISPDRIYLHFTDVPRTDWGWNGSTFG